MAAMTTNRVKPAMDARLPAIWDRALTGSRNRFNFNGFFMPVLYAFLDLSSMKIHGILLNFYPERLEMGKKLQKNS
jgi:hypothetical protein